jgi:signal transduction histidine kinase
MFQTLAPRDKFENTGIGLALVKKIVETWGGEIWLESTVGQGSTFYFTCLKGEDNEGH